MELTDSVETQRFFAICEKPQGGGGAPPCPGEG